jgi:hypothetical protein
MGEKQIRARAERAATEALQPQFDALGNLAIAADAAGKADELRAAAHRRAQQIHEAAELEIARRYDAWRQAWHDARRAGWTVEVLRSAPINQQPPPAATPKRRRPRTPRTTTPTPNGNPPPGQAAGQFGLPAKPGHN